MNGLSGKVRRMLFTLADYFSEHSRVREANSLALWYRPFPSLEKSTLNMQSI